MATATISVPLSELRDPATGRLDARRIADYLAISLRRLAAALGRRYGTVQKTPNAPTLQEALRPIARTLDILALLGADHAAALAWLNAPLPALGQRPPLEFVERGHADAVANLLDGALAGNFS